MFYEQALDATGGKGGTGYLYFVNARNGVHEKVTWEPARGAPAPVTFQGRVYVFRGSSEGDGAPPSPSISQPPRSTSARCSSPSSRSGMRSSGWTTPSRVIRETTDPGPRRRTWM